MIGVPWYSAIPANIIAAITTRIDTRRVNCSMRNTNGGFAEGLSSTASAIFPSSVFRAVPTTMLLARPRTTSEPANAIFLRSLSAVSFSQSTSYCFSTASDSPVSNDSSISKSLLLSRRTSAGIRSPETSRTISPGTSCIASIS
ncbi:hypothetical protein BMS3Bbin11_00224 [bacterium BMS3Bbin11]|nr:hypothetical protein BMS3Bbin11_00224 [bacterium BMS3Bbin11]